MQLFRIFIRQSPRKWRDAEVSIMGSSREAAAEKAAFLFDVKIEDIRLEA